MATIAMEEYELMKDSKYRMYVAAVDKALKSFEYTAEWPDLISALGKLNKVLSSYQKFPVIPRRIKISKRLAQCMHPALPSGVHRKALETYDIIFRCMGTNRLASELFIYSSGLFPLMGHAAMNIRPALLTIYETHFVPLGDRLRPALSGFLSGILPGLDTGTDHFERTNLLLENVCEGVDPPYFYTCMWQCVTNNSPVRLPAITYVLAHYSRKLPMEEQLHLLGHDIGLMISGLCAAVQDSSVLVQRSALDLLMVCFPMQNKQLLYADMVRLVTAALSTILRRDMSLNRRLYSWLLDSQSNETFELDADDEVPVSNTHLVAYDLLNDAIKDILKKCSCETPIDVKPYRLLTSLFDKPQIGPFILDSVLYDVFRTLYLSCLNAQKQRNHSGRCVSFNGDINSLKNDDGELNRTFVSRNCPELVKNANLLFNTLQSYYIWSYVEKLYGEAVQNIKKYKYRDRLTVSDVGTGPPYVLELCILTDFLLDVVPIESQAESTCNILPNLFSKIVRSLKSSVVDLNCLEILKSLELCRKILTKIQPLALVQMASNDPNPGIESASIEKSLDLATISETKSENDEQRTTIEKSKSDSKLNENMNDKHELAFDDSSRERSYSNQMLKKKEKTSPRIEKKARNKKSKSSSKLFDLKTDDAAEEADKREAGSKEVDRATSSPAPPSKIENKYFAKCLEEYKTFYVSFVETKILPDVDIERYLQSLTVDIDQRTKQLEKLLDGRLADEQRSKFVPVDYTMVMGSRRTDIEDVAPEDSVCDHENGMSVASGILLEFCGFSNLVVEVVDQTIPAWLEALLVAACYRNSSREIQLTAMSTALEIFSLAKVRTDAGGKVDINTSVVIAGILDQQHVQYVEERTLIIEEMSKILWSVLGNAKNQNQLMQCVTLLYQIHNTFDCKSFAERVIDSCLSEDHVDANYLKRFFVLWHLGRDLNIKLPPNRTVPRNFDRSLLKVLDMLQSKDRPTLQLLSETFLTHGLLHNDLSRIINPLLSKLLSPTTARVSIRHVNIQDGDTQTETTFQDAQSGEVAQSKKVYAVSNVNGNIMYHVTDDPDPKPSKKKWFAFSKASKKIASPIVNTTTSLTEDANAVVTKKNKDFKGYAVSSANVDKESKGNVKLIINPLSSKEVYPNGIDGSYSKLDRSRSSSESLSSDDSVSNDDSLTKTYPNDNRDSGFESLKAAKLLERIEPISDGIKAAKLPKSHSFDEKTNAARDHMENTLVQSWSYCISDSANLNCELELSKSAEEFFRGKDEEYDIVTGILNAIVDRVCEKAETRSGRGGDSFGQKMAAKHFVLYPIHSHICLYYDSFDTGQVIYALHTLKNCLSCDPQLTIKCLATCGIGNDLLVSLARHRKSLIGCGFAGDLAAEHVNFYRGYTLLDVVVSVCLNYARTFFPLLDERWPSIADELDNNVKIQMESLEILNVVAKNLIPLVKENAGKGFASYIADLLVKCKIQKILLHCLLTSVRDSDEDVTFADEILLFNNFQLRDDEDKIGKHVEAFQIQLLKLIRSLIVLEYHAFPSKVSETSSAEPSEESLNSKPTVLIPKQQIFLSAILSALRNRNARNLHERWLEMVTSCLPYFGDNLKQIAVSVIHQICTNVEAVASNYRKTLTEDAEPCSDYAISQLESLTILCHYCLLDSSQTINQNVPAPTNAAAPVANPGEILNNLVNVFFSPLGADVQFAARHNSDHYQNARKTVLGHMPRIISSVAKLWQTIVSVEGDRACVYGNSKTVKQQLLEFLSPIAVHHGPSFLAAMAVAWFERRNPFASVKAVLPEPNAGQNNLVYLISAIRVIPLDNLVQTVTAVIKNPPPCEGLSSDICLDVSVLELFYCYMRNASATQLSEAWASLLSLIREVNSLSPPAQFLLAALLHEMMIKCCPLEERKDQKDLQDITAKLIDCVSQVCGSCLEQTTWLRRNYAVREQEEDTTPDSSIITGGSAEVNSSHSVQAQLVLAEILAPILDICFGSSDKDKVNNILASLMFNIVPYLKTHTVKNMPSFNACSKLLASLSSYQYTRKAWKKEVFDLLMDNSVFQMDHSCLKYWRVIVDNLMTHDNITFRDLMNRVSMTQSGSLSIFSSREQEYEQKSQLLKRLAYVIFCSELDQYAKYMPEIQEQLTGSLRMNVPGVQAQVFLCFRVLLIRMSPLHVTSLWPIIISEMLQVFLQIEQELSTDTEEFNSHIKLMSSLDASWATNSSNGLHALGHPHWLKLQLTTAKLLDLALLLPATTLPQFQMYRWAFVGDDAVRKTDRPQAAFTPHVIRIAELMDRKFADAPIDILPMKRNELLLTVNSISQLKDLHSFFRTLSSCSDRHRTECSRAVVNDNLFAERPSDKKLEVILEKIDRVIETDFLDKIPR
ncbi:protein dopey-1 homolog [Cylas formicarius]|uniref:protein dopey-1 homolog n=1 Tax=Cylas formicarius TaxID=197179 RepID=UPI0029586FE2|nr:protein dopey-1 homolog [Cylas formicarius]XP_060520915.1 protein dopey-1 homolog [Cylas formicarius]